MVLFGWGALGCGNGVESGSAQVPSASAEAAAKRPNDAVSVSVGGRHVCRLLRSGGVECWGSNDVGQLGDGTLVDKQTPVAVKDLTDAIQVTTGQEGTCAVRKGGQVVCWGRHPAWDTPRPWEHEHVVPFTVEGMSWARWVGLVGRPAPALNGKIFSAVAGAAGDLSNEVLVGADTNGIVTCVVRSNGDTSCWGNGEYGQLGNGRTAVIRAPVTVPGLTDVVKVAVTEVEGFALTESGKVYRWGGKPVMPREERTETTGPKVEDLPKVNALFGGPTGVCVRTETDKVLCKAPPGYEIQPNGMPVATEVVWKEIPNLTGVTQMVGVATGWPEVEGAHSDSDTLWYARRADGKVVAFYTARGKHTSPTPIQGVSDAEDVTSNKAYACAVRKGGKTACWHHRFLYGYIQSGSEAPAPPIVSLPVTGGVVRMEGPCAIDKNGKVACFGIGVRGGSFFKIEDPGEPAYFRVLYGSHCTLQSPTGAACKSGFLRFEELKNENMVHASVGEYAGCAVLKNKSVVCWGDSRVGPTAISGTWVSEAPTVVPRIGP